MHAVSGGSCPKGLCRRLTLEGLATMDEHNPDANGHREIKTLPPFKLGNGPEWRMPTDIAVPLLQALWNATPLGKRGQIMSEIIGGRQ
jgi:hypothetical protein